MVLEESGDFGFREGGEEAFRSRLETDGEVRGMESRWRRRDGRPLTVRENARLSRSVRGAARYWEGTAENLTESRRMGDALRATEARFEAFMDNAPCVAAVKDRESRYLWVSRKFIELFGHDREYWVNRSHFQTLPPEAAAEFRANDQEALSCGPKEFVEVAAVNGETTHWLTVKFPFASDTGDKLLGMIALNISERVRAERELLESRERLAMAHTATGLVPFDWNLTTGEMQSGAEADALFSVSNGGSMSVGEWMQLVDARDRKNASEGIESAIQDGAAHSIEYRVTTGAGSTRWITTIGKLTERTSDGLPMRLSGFSMDSTQRHKAEEALRTSKERFRTAAEVMSGLVLEYDFATRRIQISGPAATEVQKQMGRSARPLMRLIFGICHGDRRRVIAALRRLSEQSVLELEFEIDHGAIQAYQAGTGCGRLSNTQDCSCVHPDSLTVPHPREIW